MEIRSLSSRCDAMFYVRLSYDERGHRYSAANSKSRSSTGSKGAVHCAAKHHDAIKSARENVACFARADDHRA